MRLRLTLTWFVGCGVTIVATYAGTAALFGGLAVAAGGVVIVLAISTVAINRPHEGAAFSDAVREMFPEGLANYVIAIQGSPNVLP